ncbi:hypothetical protein P20495_4082 [Pseudoalteromonas sp. BSi20495]|nr:hypothetical protein P20495_4082 [Pseudoalteromonas sp. BSi20495]
MRWLLQINITKLNTRPSILMLVEYNAGLNLIIFRLLAALFVLW